MIKDIVLKDVKDAEALNLYATQFYYDTYVHVRKSADMDIIEDRTVVRNIKLSVNIDRPFTKARLVPQNIPIEVRGNEISVPEVDGYAIVELT